MKKSFRKLIPAILMVLLSASLMGTSTFAWFSMNAKVSVTGMRVHTQISENLLIAEAANSDGSGTGSNTSNLDEPIATMPTADKYGVALVQSKYALLEPVSTTSAAYDDFWYTSTTNVAASGDARTDSYIDYDATGLAGSGTNNFNTNYKTTGAVGYVDYVFAIQATNSDLTNPMYLNLTGCTLTYDDTNGTDSTGKAWRMAILVQDCSAADTASTTATLKTILAINGVASTDYHTDGKAVKTATTLDTVTIGTAATLATVTAKATSYYKVTVRLWLEGEDESCTNATYASLTGDYRLDLKIELENATTNAVQYITRGTKVADAVVSSTAPTTDKDVVIAGVTYYEFTTKSGSTDSKIYGVKIDAGVYSKPATAAAVTNWFKIDGTEVYEITNYVTTPES